MDFEASGIRGKCLQAAMNYDFSVDVIMALLERGTSSVMDLELKVIEYFIRDADLASKRWERHGYATICGLSLLNNKSTWHVLCINLPLKMTA